VSATTRPARPGELEGKDYLFVSEAQFEDWLANDGLLEWARVHKQYYGTPRAAVEQRLREGISVFLDIDTQGAFQVMETMPEAISIFIEPPTMEDLERRLRGRGTECGEQLRTRLAAADHEMARKMRYTYRLVNDDVAVATDELRRIIDSEEAK